MGTALETLGIRPAQDIPVEVLLGENFNGSLYGLDTRQMRKVRALRDIVVAYGQASRTEVRKVTCARDAVSIAHPGMKDLQHEEVAVILLNRANTVLHVETLYRGSAAEVAFSPRDIISRALSMNAAALVLTHNHPSGNPEPSKADITQTEALKKACNVFEIALLDHVIISRNSYYSFADERTAPIDG